MSMPHKLFRKLQETLGEEGAQAMADWMGEVGSRTDDLRGDISELRHEMDVKFADLREEMRVGFARAEAATAQRHADLLKWMLGFWVISLATVVAEIIGFARTLR